MTVSKPEYMELMFKCVTEALAIQKKAGEYGDRQDRIDAVITPPRRSGDITAIAIELFRANLGTPYQNVGLASLLDTAEEDDLRTLAQGLAAYLM